MASCTLRQSCRGLAQFASRLTGFVFDIDGVIRKGPDLIPGADLAIQRVLPSPLTLNEPPWVLQLYEGDRVTPRYPLCFLTNGGGVTEATKASELSSLLGVHITEHQVVMSHTPMRPLAQRYGDLPVLVAGKGDPLAVAQAYGFSKAVTADQLYHAMPSAAPFTLKTAPPENPCPIRELNYGTAEAPFRSVMVFTDPIDWARDLQLMTDVVISHGVPGALPSKQSPQKQSVDVFIGHNDLLWANDFPVPRFGLGAFSLAFQTLYSAYTGIQPAITHFGKPTPSPFKLAEELLKEQSEALGYGQAPLEQIYMVGDNPAADIRGARNVGAPWIPVLVRTGVFNTSCSNAIHDPADIVTTDVLEFITKTV